MGQKFFEQPVSFSPESQSKSEVELTMEEAVRLLEEMNRYKNKLREVERELESQIEQLGGKGTLIKELEELRRNAEWFDEAGEDFKNRNIEKILVSRV